MNDNIAINIEEIKLITDEIDTKKKEIINIYNQSLKNLIQNSRESIVKSNMSYEVIDSKFRSLFEQFDNNLSLIVNTLKRDIITNYESLSDDLNNLFNKQLMEGLNSLLENKENR